MKLFISSDIEGTCGICDWDETEISKPMYYERFADQMTREVAAAVRAAQESGKVEDILIKDAHDYARNLRAENLPECIRIIRGWEGGPGSMMAGITKCDAAAMTGYHSSAYSMGNPLAHTMNTQNQWVKINGAYASEFLINTYFAAYYGKPVIFLSGDQALCDTAKELIPEIETAPVMEGSGSATISIHPRKAEELIHDRMAAALRKDPKACLVNLPEYFEVEIQFKEAARARRGSFYPGARRIDTKTVAFEHHDYYEVARFFYFVL